MIIYYKYKDNNRNEKAYSKDNKEKIINISEDENQGLVCPNVNDACSKIMEIADTNPNGQ